MSLHCPATLLVSRHGDAAYDHPPQLGNDGGRLTDTGRDQVAALAKGLADRRIAAVYSSAMTPAAQSAEIAAEALGVPARRLSGLDEVHVADLQGAPFENPRAATAYAAWRAGDLDARLPGAESGRQVRDRLRAALETISDLHRGEHVLVFSHGALLTVVLPLVAVDLTGEAAREPFLAHAAPIMLECGDDGWFIRSWPGL
ncbi:MAG: histidine phosphatase family protein [Austwickia sp.]|nr:histidine phosphatase family protein [Actinomycetota bacterium]MCB1253667.1 histidine phosphatase family protein [Austwickia sp.]MCO5309929.1 histidine phosphatase family protein [Austwickia sp.]